MGPGAVVVESGPISANGGVTRISMMDEEEVGKEQCRRTY